MMEHIERLKIFQLVALPEGLDRQTHQNRLLKLVREGQRELQHAAPLHSGLSGGASATGRTSSGPDRAHTVHPGLAAKCRAAPSCEGQVDKGANPYILDDVVEDCGISLDDLRKEGFSEVVLTAIESVTKVPGESYEAIVERAAQNPIGRVVKLADLEENSDLSRIAQQSWEDLERIEKYWRAIGVLRS